MTPKALLNVVYYLMTAEATDEQRREFRSKAGLSPIVLDEEGREVPDFARQGQTTVNPDLWVAGL